MTARKKRRPGRPGRPKGSGAGPPELVRRHRVVVMLNDGDLERLEELADELDLPRGTAAYGLLAHGLARARRATR